MSRDDAFAEFASGRWLSLARSAVLLGASHTEAEDLAQTVLMRCYVSWPKVCAATCVDAYVARMLVNEFSRSRRRRWWRERPTEVLPEVGTLDVTAQVDGADAIARALASLGPRMREVVVLRHYVNLSQHQIADALGIPEGTVKSRLSRAHQRLADDEHLAYFRDGTTR